MTYVNRIISINATIPSISTSMTDTPRSRTSELCSNWWPVPSLANAKTIPGMPHPLCRICANWLPEIEDISTLLDRRDCMTKKMSSCGNDWPQERNVIKPLLPTSSPSVPKEEPLLLSTLNLSAPRTDPKLQ
jgi:hypothetical protein